MSTTVIFVYMAIAFLSMIFFAFMQRFGIVNKSSHFSLILSAIAWPFSWAVLAWIAFYHFVLNPILSLILGDHKK